MRRVTEAGQVSKVASNALILAHVGVLAAITAIVYVRGTSAGFVGDDFMILHRLRSLAGVADLARFFRTEFFEYYRPLGFVSQGLDYLRAGASPQAFHATSLALHVVNTILVWLIARRLSPGTAAATLAALLFALHASGHEAVIWVSARFDLLATAGALTATLCLLSDNALAWIAGPVLLLAAVLAKESAVALPIAAAAWMGSRSGATTARTLVKVAPWLLAVGVYAWMRHSAGGVSALGGPGRGPKVIVLAAGVALPVFLAGTRWSVFRDRVAARRRAIAVTGAVCLAGWLALVVAGFGAMGQLAREKAVVAGYGLYYLSSPLVDLVPSPAFVDQQGWLTPVAGVIAAAAALLIVLIVWHRWVRDDRYWFVIALGVAMLLPVSALSEGKRYFYLPSAAVAIGAAILMAETRTPRRIAAYGATVVLLAVSVWQIERKIADWRWAGQMTSNGAALVNAALSPDCASGHVVFLTSPVGVRGVYTHFYYETFEPIRGCTPDRFDILSRLTWRDTHVEVAWPDPRHIIVSIPDYTGNLVLSSDLRNFDAPLRTPRELILHTPIGDVEARTDQAGGARVTLTLADPDLTERASFFYYSDGAMHRIARDARAIMRP
jgi:hypothetical protein